MSPDRLNGLPGPKMGAEKRNFTVAAKTLGISSSVVSQGIEQLEGRLGVALLSRTIRSSSLPEAGERFLRQAGPALDQILGALEEVGTYAEKPSGLLRLDPLGGTIIRADSVDTPFVFYTPRGRARGAGRRPAVGD